MEQQFLQPYSGVSGTKATVPEISKFVKKLGYESYFDFKDACIEYLEAQIQKKQIFRRELDADKQYHNIFIITEIPGKIGIVDPDRHRQIPQFNLQNLTD